jgi:putative tryptophan/tyrosine transport system substrate-binding protein
MRRRELLLMATSIIAARAVRAEQKSMPVIGFLGTSPQNAGFLDPFRQGLSEIGYVEGNNVAMEYREAHFHYDQLPALAADLVKRKVDVLVTANGTTPALAAKNATSTIPIVFTFVSDPVGIGLVASLARPGGNVTGFSNIAASLGPKQMQLISELVPQADAIAVLVNPNNSAAELLIRDTQLAAHEKGLKLVVLKASKQKRSILPSPPSFSCKSAPSSSTPTGSSIAGVSNSLRWRRAMLCRRCIRAAST